MFLNGADLSHITTRKGHLCEPFTSGLWRGRLMTASRKAERLSGGWVCLDRRQGEPACTRMPETGENPVKMAFSNFPLIWRFREVLGVSYQDELQAKIKLIFFVFYKKMEKMKK